MNKNIIYLDNAATTKPCDEAVAAMTQAAEHYGNPSSLHGMGLDAERLVEDARKVIASGLGVRSDGIFFTSGGTEANNTAIFGAAEAGKRIGRHIITSMTEHPSVLEAFKRLEKNGFEADYIPPLPNGEIDLDALCGSLRKDTVLVSVMHVNNETGVISPISEIREMIRKKSPSARLHCDCVQSFGKIDTKRLGADLISVSAHKIHGFKGTGALYAANKNMIRPLLYGGEQQKEIRPGTENVGGILAFAAAFKKSAIDGGYLRELRKAMKEGLSRLEYVKFNGSDELNSGSVLNVSFTGIKAEILLHALEARGVYVSTGSACSSRKPQPSHVLTAMGIGKKEIDGAVRISFDRVNTIGEIRDAAEIIAHEAEKIRRYM